MENYTEVKACELTRALKRLKQDLQEQASNDYASLVVEVSITICGMNVMYIARYFNPGLNISMEVVANCVSLLRTKFTTALAEYPELLRNKKMAKIIVNGREKEQV